MMTGKLRRLLHVSDDWDNTTPDISHDIDLVIKKAIDKIHTDTKKKFIKHKIDDDEEKSVLTKDISSLIEKYQQQ